MSKQLSFMLPSHGGKRRGAGRKPTGATALVGHAARPRFAEVRRCFCEARGLHGLRLVEFSVLNNHLHLIVEADDHVALSRGIQGLSVRLARALNRHLQRNGKLFADHFHSRLLPTPTELCRAIRYVVENAARHYGEPDTRCSSRAPENSALLVAPVGWLLRVGWQRANPRDHIAPVVLSQQGLRDEAIAGQL